MIKAVIFDIDGTISPEISWVALTRDLGASVEEHDMIFKRFLSGDLSYEDSKKQLIEMWNKTGNANKTYITHLFHQWTLYPEASELFSYLHKRQIITCLITGSFDLYAQVFAKRLGVKHFYANTKLLWDEKGNLMDFDYVKNQSEEKVNHLKEFCKTTLLSADECIVVGDDDNDTGIFTLTGKGISVISETSHKLDAVAWKKAQNLEEVKHICQKALQIA